MDAVRQSNDQRGSMLIVALGILALLSVMALTFVKLMNLERIATKNYVDGVKARLVAEGGLELSIEQLKRAVSVKSHSTLDDPWVYAKGDFWRPLEQATTKRFAPGALIPADQHPVSFAGSLGVSYMGGLDQYKVKVLDTQTQFDLNSTLDFRGDPVNLNLLLDFGYIRFLDVLGVAISERPSDGPGSPPLGRNPIRHARWLDPVAGEVRGGKAIFLFRQSRENGEFKSKTELLEILANEDDFLLLKDYVTAHCWRDPKTILTRGPQSETDDTLDSRPWSDVKRAVSRSEYRSPINVNLATKEILAANLAGIAGRGLFVWAENVNEQNVDAGTPFEYAQYKEELDYTAKGIVAYVPPLGYRPGQNPGDPPIIDGAMKIAEAIVAERLNGRYFKSYADWERWVDTKLTDSFLSGTDSSGQPMFPSANQAGSYLTELDGKPLASPTPTVVVANKRFISWYSQAIRSVIKANFNPNARLSSFNPDSVVYLPIDKGGLLFKNRSATDPNDPDRTLHPCQTFEWCFAPKGVFEITTLGEVLGPVPEDVARRQDLDGDKQPDLEMFAQAKVRGIMQLYETESLRTQRDFETKGNLDEYHLERLDVASFPIPKVYWDPRVQGLANTDVDEFYTDWTGNGLKPSDRAGYLQLSTVTQLENQPGEPDRPTSIVRAASTGERPKFELLLQDRRVGDPANSIILNADALFADTANGVVTKPNQRHGSPVGVRPDLGGSGVPRNKHAWPYGKARDGIWPTVNSSKPLGELQDAWRWEVLTPDGYLNSVLRPSLLWYRAADNFTKESGGTVEFPTYRELFSQHSPGGLGSRPGPNYDFDAKRQGTSFDSSAAEGNVAAAPKGGFELWFKPEFDWSVRDANGNATNEVDQRFCGLLSTSHAIVEPDGADPVGKVGVRSRGTQMFLTRTTSGELRLTRLYYEAVGPADKTREIPYVMHPVTNVRLSLSEYFTACTTDPLVQWPPAELRDLPPDFRNIQWARTDYWFDKATFKDWQSHEWHHIAFVWDDDQKTYNSDFTQPSSLRAYFDGHHVAPIHANQVGKRYMPKKWDPNATPPAIVDDPTLSLASDGMFPQFVRLNATGFNASGGGELQPRDQITVGAIHREQYLAGNGLFKHDTTTTTLLPANGTVDDLRFYSGNRAERYKDFEDKFAQLGRYAPAGTWRGEVSPTKHFPDDGRPLRLGSFDIVGYLPTVHAGQVAPNGAGTLRVELTIVDASGSPVHGPWEIELRSNGDDAGAPLLHPPGSPLAGQPVTIGRTERLVYLVTFEAARLNVDSAPIASPVLDELSVIFFLPNPKVLLKERMNF